MITCHMGSIWLKTSWIDFTISHLCVDILKMNQLFSCNICLLCDRPPKARGKISYVANSVHVRSAILNHQNKACAKINTPKITRENFYQWGIALKPFRYIFCLDYLNLLVWITHHCNKHIEHNNHRNAMVECK